MKLMKKLIILCFTTLLVFSFNITDIAKASEVSETSLSLKDKLEVTNRMHDEGSSDWDIQNVLRKIEKGEVLESEKAMADEQVFFFSFEELEELEYFQNNKLEKKVEFKDGSYLKSEIILEAEDISNLKNRNIALAANGAFKTFTVKGVGTHADASYKVSIFIDTHLGNSYINKVYPHPNIAAHLGTHSDTKQGTTRKYENRAKKIPAQAYLYFKYTNFANLSSQDMYLKVFVGDHYQNQYGIKVTYTNGKGYIK
ncbi:hypothetical protein CSV61_10120 [Sporosarcina sp. P3]|uniref:hypothetical protein n=1 Tax=Sporosarcina sp. P3 TaxID=2048245 RepID=UPI000C170C07|nr:hypothetical protein [Sporosarcina sp. P3]PID21169.1 hypothetical protein CSV61_10120 [Sporosarcina sp. P3]